MTAVAADDLAHGFLPDHPNRHERAGRPIVEAKGVDRAFVSTPTRPERLRAARRRQPASRRASAGLARRGAGLIDFRIAEFGAASGARPACTFDRRALGAPDFAALP